MAFVCIMPGEISIINQNYESTAQIYEAKRESILARLKQEQNISGEDFINTIQTNYSSLLKEKYPVYAPVVDAISLKQKLQSVLKLSDAKKVVGKLDKALSDCGAEKVSPKKMISDYISKSE